MNKRITLLVLLLVITMVAGCKKNQNVPQQTTIATTTSTAVTTEQETTHPTEAVVEKVEPDEHVPEETNKVGVQKPTESIKPIETTPPRPSGSTSSATEPSNPSETTYSPAESYFDEIGENQTPPRK